ncbi:MAG: hypothetical protein GX085_05480 [Firmicutes bacterium]|nr:hypothetical protein [Bacillota bacterium]
MKISPGKKFTEHWQRILVLLGLVFLFLAVVWIFLGAFSPAAEKNDGTIRSFPVWQETGTVLAAAGQDGLLAYMVRVGDEREDAGRQEAAREQENTSAQENTGSRFKLLLQKLTTDGNASAGTRARPQLPAEIVAKDLPELEIPVEAAGICMSLTPDGTGLWLSLFNNEGKNQTVFFDLETKQRQVFSFTDRMITGNITVSSLVEKRLFYPAAGKDGKIFANTDRDTLDLPIELFAMNADASSVAAGFRP